MWLVRASRGTCVADGTFVLTTSSRVVQREHLQLRIYYLHHSKFWICYITLKTPGFKVWDRSEWREAISIFRSIDAEKNTTTSDVHLLLEQYNALNPLQDMQERIFQGLESLGSERVKLVYMQRENPPHVNCLYYWSRLIF